MSESASAYSSADACQDALLTSSLLVRVTPVSIIHAVTETGDGSSICQARNGMFQHVHPLDWDACLLVQRVSEC
jgi:hypothetical protein